MTRLEPVTFESTAGKEIYKHIERNGPQPVAEVERAVSPSGEEFRKEVDTLLENGYVERRDDTLGIKLDLGGSETYGTGDFEYTIRPAGEADFEGLVEVIEEIAERKTYVVADELASSLRYDDTVLRHDSIHSRIFFVATNDDDIIGWSHLNLPLVDYMRGTAQLTVGVREDFRGYEVGTELLNRALDWAADAGYQKVYNNVAQTNMQAVSFLENRGWDEEGVRENHYTIGHKQVDEVMMAYTF